MLTPTKFLPISKMKSEFNVLINEYPKIITIIKDRIKQIIEAKTDNLT